MSTTTADDTTKATTTTSTPTPTPTTKKHTNLLIVLSYLTIVGLWISSQYILIPYVVHLLVLVTAILYVGCHWSLILLQEEEPEIVDNGDGTTTTTTSGGVQGETLSKEDAMSFPIVGSCSLFGLYLAFKLLDRDLVNLLIGLYFGLVGTFALTATVAPGLYVLLQRNNENDSSSTDSSKSSSILDRSWKLEIKKDIAALAFCKPMLGMEADQPLVDIDLELSTIDILALVPSAILCIYYFKTKHWTLNNVLGICFCIQGIERFSLGTYKIGAILLIGLFFYDIFWVFGTDVMVTVAKNLDGPIKILFPRSLTPNEETGKIELSLLGLGDIVIPGFFLALLLRFDAHKAEFAKGQKEIDIHGSFPKPYFHSCLVGYFLGLAMTMFVMIQFEAAQPALLYLVPACLGSSFLCAISRGEWSELLEYSEEKEEEEEEKKKENGDDDDDKKKEDSAEKEESDKDNKSEPVDPATKKEN